VKTNKIDDFSVEQLETVRLVSLLRLNNEQLRKKMSSILKIGFLGGGRIAQAMANGFISAGKCGIHHHKSR
jgi:hypothetical protein